MQTFQSGQGEPASIVWFRVPESTPQVRYFTRMRSFVWENKEHKLHEEWSGVGEQVIRSTSQAYKGVGYYNGAPPAAYTADHVCGSKEVWENGGTVEDGFFTNTTGQAPCCTGYIPPIPPPDCALVPCYSILFQFPGATGTGDCDPQAFAVPLVLQTSGLYEGYYTYNYPPPTFPLLGWNYPSLLFELGPSGLIPTGISNIGGGTFWGFTSYDPQSCASVGTIGVDFDGVSEVVIDNGGCTVFLPFFGGIANGTWTITAGCGGSSGSSGGPSPNCFLGQCGGDGVATELMCTVTNMTGCYTTIPQHFNLPCFNSGTLQVAYQDQTGDGFTICGAGGQFPIVAWDDITNSPYLTEFGNATLNQASTWQCSPFAAVFEVSDGAGNSCTVTAVGVY